MFKDFLKNNSWFLIGWLLLITVLVTCLLRFDHAGSFIFLNPYHTPALDYFFKNITFLGDGIFIIATAVVLFFAKQKKHSILILISYGFSGLIVQILKHSFPAERPRLFFENHHIHYDYFLNNITLHTINSFPSGHTASVFALAASLTFLTRKWHQQIVYLVAAILVGYSRIYLGQHFPLDVTAGAAIGVCAAMVCYAGVEKYYPSKLRNN